MRTYQIAIDGKNQTEVFTSIPEACTRLRELRETIVHQGPSSMYPGSERTVYAQDMHRTEVVSVDGTPLTNSEVAALVAGTMMHRRNL